MLKIAVAIMTTFLILGIFALVYGVARQASKMGAGAKPAALSAQSLYGQALNLGAGELAERFRLGRAHRPALEGRGERCRRHNRWQERARAWPDSAPASLTAGWKRKPPSGEPCAENRTHGADLPLS